MLSNTEDSFFSISKNALKPKKAIIYFNRKVLKYATWVTFTHLIFNSEPIFKVLFFSSLVGKINAEKNYLISAYMSQLALFIQNTVI